MLLDEAPKVDSYKELKEINDTKLYTFPLSKRYGGTITLNCVKMQIFCPLISSAEKDSPVGYDCFYEIMEANRTYFESLEKNSSSTRR